MPGIQSVNTQFNQALALESGFASEIGVTITGSFDPARAQLDEMAADYGNQSLKLRLAQENTSLSDHADVGKGQRFEAYGDKLSHILGRKVALLLQIRMDMMANNNWGPSNSDEVKSIRGSKSAK